MQSEQQPPMLTYVLCLSGTVCQSHGKARAQHYTLCTEWEED